MGRTRRAGKEFVYTLRQSAFEPSMRPVVAAAYRYNGLGHRIGFHHDVDADGTVESTADDPWTYYAYDERWRLLATFTGANTAPTEEWLHHNAGLGGRGGSSYIDSVILRDRDTTGDGTLEERRYLLQNWRADVIAVTTNTGEVLERARYDAYGRPIHIDRADLSDASTTGGLAGGSE